MKGLILAGGAGTRLRPITHTSAKQLVPVANKPILFYGLDAMAEAGIRRVGIVVGDTRAEVQAAVGDGSRWGLDVTWIPQDRPLGLAHCVLIARQFLADEDFVMYLGDNLLTQGIAGLVTSFEAERDRLAQSLEGLATGEADKVPAAQILLARVSDPHRFGVAVLDQAGEVTDLVEKPADPPSDLALVGVYVFDPHIHQAVAAITPSARGELEITDAIRWLLRRGHRVRCQVVEGYWKDLGELEALLEGNRLVLESLPPRVEGTVDEGSRIEGRVILEAGSQLVRSTVRGPVIIGERTRVEDSFIGPFTAIASDCEILRSEVEHSVVLDGSRVVDVGRIEDSLIGREVSVLRTAGRPRASRLMVGDHSWVDLG